MVTHVIHCVWDPFVCTAKDISVEKQEQLYELKSEKQEQLYELKSEKQEQLYEVKSDGMLKHLTATGSDPLMREYPNSRIRP